MIFFEEKQKLWFANAICGAILADGSVAPEELEFLEEPLVMNFRINAGHIPLDHWIQRESGGGRIIGEICHFIDLMQFFTKSLPIKLYAECISAENIQIKNEDNIIISIKFQNGSIGNLTYVANGDKSMPKERYEISCGGNNYIINDFKSLDIYKNNKHKSIKKVGKGHKQEVEAFLKSVSDKGISPISFQSICYTTLATFKILDSIRTGLPQQIII